MGKRTVSFSVTGEFVTRTAREWLWLEGKPWSVVEELLLSCMCGTDKSREELVELATKVVIGRAKFIGNTGDGSYAMVEDDQDLIGKYIGQWNKKVSEMKKDLREMEDKYCSLTSYLIDSGKGYLIQDAGIDDDDGEDPSAYDMVNSFIKQKSIEREGHKDNYGWLEPDGTFHPVEFAEHNGFALEVIKSRGWGKEFSISDVGGIYACGDFLTEKKGWALIHNPGMGVAFVTSSDTKPLTKAQREFLYGYYSDRGLWKQAEQYLEG